MVCGQCHAWNIQACHRNEFRMKVILIPYIASSDNENRKIFSVWNHFGFYKWNRIFMRTCNFKTLSSNKKVFFNNNYTIKFIFYLI